MPLACLDALQGTPFDPVATRARLLGEIEELRRQRPIDRAAMYCRLLILGAMDRCADLVPYWCSKLAPVSEKEA